MYKLENIKIAYSVDKHCFSVYLKDNNQRLFYETRKYKTIKLIELCDAIYRNKITVIREAELIAFLKDHCGINAE